MGEGGVDSRAGRRHVPLEHPFVVHGIAKHGPGSVLIALWGKKKLERAGLRVGVVLCCGLAAGTLIADGQVLAPGT